MGEERESVGAPCPLKSNSVKIKVFLLRNLPRALVMQAAGVACVTEKARQYEQAFWPPGQGVVFRLGAGIHFVVPSRRSPIWFM